MNAYMHESYSGIKVIQAFNAEEEAIEEIDNTPVIEETKENTPKDVIVTITKEVKISDLVHFLSIDQDPCQWVDEIMNSISESKRINRKIEIR